MIRIFHNTDYDFIKWWKVSTVLTIIFLVAGAVAFAVRGVHYSVEFTGGTLQHISFTKAPEINQIRQVLSNAGFDDAEIQQFGGTNEFTMRVAGEDDIASQAAGAEDVAVRLEHALQTAFVDNGMTILRTEAVGPRVGEELSRNALIAILISFAIVLVYLAVRFEWRFALAAIISTAHDVFAAMAFIFLMDLEVSLTIVAALLTVLGYSLNDTIIIFDRTRENIKKGRVESLTAVLNRSINETLPRSVLTHMTTGLATLALLLFAGDVIRPFSWVMMFGIVVSVFSSIYIASPILVWVEHKWPRASAPWKNLSTATPTSPTQRSKATAAR